jgi:hypothetical protein
VAICEQLLWMSYPHGGRIKMSGSISRKKRRKAMRQQRKDEVRWYSKFFAEVHNDESFPQSAYALLTSEQIIRLTQGPGIHRK